MPSQNISTSPVRPYMMVDEFQRVLDIRKLEAEVLKLPGVPNARYVACNGQVFVFKKLISDILKGQVDVTQSPQVSIDRAWVDAIEATTVYGVMPAGFEIEVVDQKYLIRHEALWARIPVEFSSAHEARVALASVLLGHPVAGSGDFQFEGQWLVFDEPLSLAVPEKPTLEARHVPNDKGELFQHPAYEPGLAAFTFPDYQFVKDLVNAWCADLKVMAEVADTEYPDVWAKVVSMELPKPYCTQNFEHPDNSELRDQAAELARLYPELEGLSASHLHSHYCTFVGDFTGHVDIEFARDEEFSVYLLGMQALPDLDEDLVYASGLHVWYSLKRGDTWEEACAFAQSCQAYNEAVFSLHARFMDAMRTLSSTNARRTALASQGLLCPGVTSVGPAMNFLERFMREARKCNLQTMSATQDKSKVESDVCNQTLI